MNYSGCFSREKKVCEEKTYEKKSLTSTLITTTTTTTDKEKEPETQQIKPQESEKNSENSIIVNEVMIGTNSDLIHSGNYMQPINPLDENAQEDIDDFKQIFEDLRIENPQIFQKVITLNKIFLDKVKNFNKDDPQNEILYLERIIHALENDLKLSIVYLHWCLNKSIRLAILEIKNIELIHFFLITKKFRLCTNFFSEILCEFIRSFEDIDFLEAEEMKVFAWVTILHMLINYGKADINQQEKMTLCTPLHLSIFFKQYQFIIILLKLGSSTEITNKHGLTPLMMVEENIKNNYDVAIYEEIKGLLYAFDEKLI